MPWVAVLALVVLALGGGSAAAQPQLGPPPPAGLSCEDQLREVRVNLQITTLGQIRERAEAARELAQLMKQVEALRAEQAAMKAAIEALTPKKPPAAPAPK